ncbi:MAG: hypothetical protein J6U54_07785 [Clostridiales bacterium]|nr:hypothetical protein [Clostridiales bacterium]
MIILGLLIGFVLGIEFKRIVHLIKIVFKKGEKIYNLNQRDVNEIEAKWFNKGWKAGFELKTDIEKAKINELEA